MRQIVRRFFPSGITGWSLPTEPPPAPVVVPETVAPLAGPDRVQRVADALDRVHGFAAGAPRPAAAVRTPQVRMPYQFGCGGLCAGDGCEQCQALADHITRTKALKNIEFQRRRIRELEEQVAALTAQNTTLKEARP